MTDILRSRMPDLPLPKRCSRRRTIATLLMFANEIERKGQISKASKAFLKELIVHENTQVMSVGDSLDSSPGRQDLALKTLHALIKLRASKSHEELFEICPLEDAHLLSQEDKEALVKGTDTKSLVYGEVDFWSFYDIIRTAVQGIDTSAYAIDDLAKDISCEENSAKSADAITDEGEKAYGNQARTRSERKPQLFARRVNDVSEADRFRSTDGMEKDPLMEQSHGLKFYDLGSGSGRAVFAAVLAVDFRCAVGIELLASVHKASTRVFRRYRRLVEPVLSSPALIKLYHADAVGATREAEDEMEYFAMITIEQAKVQGSFLAREFDWTDGDLVFANSTCFAEDTLSAIAARAVRLRPGARVVTFTNALKTPWLRVLLKRPYMMSWGPATVYIHQKLSPEEFSKRMVEKTPFDEDQGISRCGAGIQSLVPSVIYPDLPSPLQETEATSGEDSISTLEDEEGELWRSWNSCPRRPRHC